MTNKKVTKEEMIKNIAKNVREYREKRGMTLEQVANKASCSNSLINMIEREKTLPSFNKLHDIAEALNVRLPKLLSDDEIEIGDLKINPIILKRDFQEYLNITEKIYNSNVPYEVYEKVIKTLIKKHG